MDPDEQAALEAAKAHVATAISLANDASDLSREPYSITPPEASALASEVRVVAVALTSIAHSLAAAVGLGLWEIEQDVRR